MASRLRGFARRALGVARTPTYYLPWLTHPGLDCVILVSNIEARFKPEFSNGPIQPTVRQYDAEGELVRSYEVSLASSTDTSQVLLDPAGVGYGFAVVDVSQIHSDLYTTLSDSRCYTATHGRHEFVETYPIWTRLLLSALGRLLALAGRTIPAFRREQYVYTGADSHSHLLIMNLSNVVNRIRMVASENVSTTRSSASRRWSTSPGPPQCSTTFIAPSSPAAISYSTTFAQRARGLILPPRSGSGSRPCSSSSIDTTSCKARSSLTDPTFSPRLSASASPPRRDRSRGACFSR